MAYCEVTDIKLGNIPLPPYLDTQKEVNDAADEIDSKIGYWYSTPIDLGAGSLVVRPARLFLKRINSSLATGRILLAIASPEENRNLHAYGWSLIQEAQAALQSIAAGEIHLEGAPLAPGASAASEGASTAPKIYNVDAESNVEAFYDRIANPYYQRVSYINRNPDGFVG